MNIPIETILFFGSLLIFLSVLASKLADKFALPLYVRELLHFRRRKADAALDYSFGFEGAAVLSD
ncbi:MAG: hypothetical protein GX598_02595 [Elusimicrobia bacterium]|nr:hypothetical protein [Elusimicrobiota bacterium]